MTILGGNQDTHDQPIGKYATTFKSSAGEVLVYGALVVAALSFALALHFNEANFLFLTILGFASSFYFYPYVDTQSEQLGADRRGIYVGGLGRISWDCVEDLKIRRIYIRTIETAELLIKLNRPLNDAVIDRDQVGWLRRYMSKHWTLKKERTLSVKLTQLFDKIDTIEKGLMRFWKLSSRA